MNKSILILLLIFGFLSPNFGQEMNEIKLYINIFLTADSLNKSCKIQDLDSSVFISVKELNNQHPSSYYKVSGEYLSKSFFNEAAFIYFLGNMRFSYFNSVNPDYQPSGDGALYSSLSYVLGEPIYLFLKTNINNYIYVLKSAISYYDENDYKFFPKNKKTELYYLQSKKYKELIDELELNKEEFIAKWDAESEKFKKALNSYNEEIEKDSK